ncbi:MAG TPA: potassium-transporting ATPase subunit KdpC [Edaphobacter sp.]
MKKHLVTACLYTLVTAVGLGLVYPLVVTGLAQLAFRDKANGQLMTENGQPIGSRIIGQPFTGPGFFHSRPSAAGTGYDATSSGGSNLAPTSQALADRVNKSVNAVGTGSPVPIDLVTASGSGLDPDITPAAAFYQVPRVASERKIPEETVRKLVVEHIQQRQLGLLGEPRVNVLELNLSLSRMQH